MAKGDERGSGNVLHPQAAREEVLDALEVLSTLAQLDLAAAHAYGVVADAAEDLPAMQEVLRRFRDDHLRHVRELNRLLRARGGREVDLQTRPGDELLPRLARLSIPLGPAAALLALLTDEQQTNSAYEAVAEFQWDDEAAEVLAANAADEEEHLQWLSEMEDELGRTMRAPEGPPV